jgi:hypothetical protein|tara:strand:+ start:178 stop:813 length:636 start_codon:yes stop_codon:yes gene_type:complete
MNLLENRENGNQSIEYYTETHLQYLGLIFFIVVFAICLPYVMYKHKMYEFLAMYFPNLDLIATCLNFQGGPFELNMFKYLYSDDEPVVGYLSLNIIGLISMMGVLAVLFKKTEHLMKKGSDNIMSKVMSIGMIMLTVTFFFPNRYIRIFNEYVYNSMSKLFVNMSKNKLWFLTFFIGMVFSFAIIKLEASVNESIINDNLTKIIHNIIHHI